MMSLTRIILTIPNLRTLQTLAPEYFGLFWVRAATLTAQTSSQAPWAKTSLVGATGLDPKGPIWLK